MGDSICWAAYEGDTQFTLFDLYGPKKQCLIFKRNMMLWFLFMRLEKNNKDADEQGLNTS